MALNSNNLPVFTSENVIKSINTFFYDNYNDMERVDII